MHPTLIKKYLKKKNCGLNKIKHNLTFKTYSDNHIKTLF